MERTLAKVAVVLGMSANITTNNIHTKTSLWALLKTVWVYISLFYVAIGLSELTQHNGHYAV